MTRKRRPIPIAVAAAILATSAAARAQGTLDPASLATYGGVYSPDCRNPNAPRLRVLADHLVIEEGARRVIGRNPRAERGGRGPNPPPGYQVELVGDLRDGLHLVFVVYRDQNGPYIGLDGEEKVRAAMRAMVGWRFLSCGASGPASGAAPLAPRPPAPPPPSPPAVQPSAAQPAAPADAPGVLDADMVRRYGGPYSSACADPAAPRVRVTADALTVEHGPKRVEAHNLESMHSYYGNSGAPDDFRVALTGALPGGGLTFLVSSDKVGRYIELEQDPKLVAMFGKAIVTRKFRSCEATPKEARPTPPAPAAVPANAVTMPWDLPKDPQFKAAYRKALGPKLKASWLMTLEGPADANRKVEVAGVPYVFAASCKPHDCGDNTIVLLYSATQKVVYAKVVETAASRLVGAPPPTVAAELDRLWLATFKQTR